MYEKRRISLTSGQASLSTTSANSATASPSPVAPRTVKVEDAIPPPKSVGKTMAWLKQVWVDEQKRRQEVLAKKGPSFSLEDPNEEQHTVDYAWRQLQREQPLVRKTMAELQAFQAKTFETMRASKPTLELVRASKPTLEAVRASKPTLEPVRAFKKAPFSWAHVDPLDPQSHLCPVFVSDVSTCNPDVKSMKFLTSAFEEKVPISVISADSKAADVDLSDPLTPNSRLDYTVHNLRRTCHWQWLPPCIDIICPFLPAVLVDIIRSYALYSKIDWVGLGEPYWLEWELEWAKEAGFEDRSIHVVIDLPYTPIYGGRESLHIPGLERVGRDWAYRGRLYPGDMPPADFIDHPDDYTEDDPQPKSNQKDPNRRPWTLEKDYTEYDTFFHTLLRCYEPLPRKSDIQDSRFLIYALDKKTGFLAPFTTVDMSLLSAFLERLIGLVHPWPPASSTAVQVQKRLAVLRAFWQSPSLKLLDTMADRKRYLRQYVQQKQLASVLSPESLLQTAVLIPCTSTSRNRYLAEWKHVSYLPPYFQAQQTEDKTRNSIEIASYFAGTGSCFHSSKILFLRLGEFDLFMKCLYPIDPLPSGRSTTAPLYYAPEDRQGHPWLSDSIVNIWTRHNCTEDTMHQSVQQQRGGFGPPINWVCTFLAQRILYHDVLLFGRRNGMMVPITSEEICQLFVFRQLYGTLTVVPTPETSDFWDWDSLVEKSKTYAAMQPQLETLFAETMGQATREPSLRDVLGPSLDPFLDGLRAEWALGDP